MKEGFILIYTEDVSIMSVLTYATFESARRVAREIKATFEPGERAHVTIYEVSLGQCEAKVIWQSHK